MNLGNKIRELRRARNLTQEQLAASLNISAQAVSKWEMGTSYPDMTMIPTLAALFKVSLDELFAKVDFINNIYLKYEDKIDSLIAKLASADIGGIGGSVEDNVNSEYWEDIIFGNDEYNRFNLDTIFDFVAPHLDDIRVDNPDNWYDKTADGYIRFVIDEYRIAPKDASITIDRYFQ